MTEKHKEAYPCPLQLTINVLNGKWKWAILWNLRTEKLRFVKLKNCLPGISNKTLSKQLRQLEEKELIKRDVLVCVPVRVEYSLTETGKAVVPVLKTMYKAGLNYSNRFKIEIGTSPK